MKLSIVTPKGMAFDGNVDYIIVSGDTGELGILEKHIPIVVPISFGFIKKVINNTDSYHVISGGLLEFNSDIATVIAQETVEGKTYEEALKLLEDLRKEIKENNRKQVMDFTEMERELALNMREIKASKL